MAFRFSGVSFPDEITRRRRVHERIMSFNDDTGAMAFGDWWHDEGADFFVKWLLSHKEVEYRRQGKEYGEKKKV